MKQKGVTPILILDGFSNFYLRMSIRGMEMT